MEIVWGTTLQQTNTNWWINKLVLSCNSPLVCSRSITRCVNPFVAQFQLINRIVQWYKVNCQEIGSTCHLNGDHHKEQCQQTCVHTSHHHVALWDWFSICFVSSSISCSNGICDDNKQESRLDTEQYWDIFVVSDLFPWSVICCYFTNHKQCRHQDFRGPLTRSEVPC